MSAISKLSTWILATASILLAAANAHAQVTVDEPWVRATVAQQQATGAFMRLSSKADSALVQAESPAAQHVEIHEMIMENDVMKMRQIPRLALPAGQAVELKPGGYHIMLIDLKTQVHEGNHVPMTLTFESPGGKREIVNIEAPVRPLTSGAPSGGHHNKH